jgi:hypothetical protein
MAQAELVFIAGRARITGAHPKPSTAPVGSPVRTGTRNFLRACASIPQVLSRLLPILSICRTALIT